MQHVLKKHAQYMFAFLLSDVKLFMHFDTISKENIHVQLQP